MQIVVIEVSKPQYKTKGKSKWSEIVLKYNGPQGEKEKKFPSFNDLYKEIEALEVGGTYDVRMEKDGDYFQWVAIQKVEGVAPVAATKAAGASGGNTWVDRTALDRERFEFDKEKQILIIRQSMIAAAVSLGGPDAMPQDIVKIADLFVDYVLNGPGEKKKPGRPKKEEQPDMDEPDIQ